MQITQLIYYSIASPSLDENGISGILETSLKNNAKNGITGCLLLHNDAFIQLIEGPPEATKSLYLKIERDRRHYNVRQVYSGFKETRLFEKWGMAFFDLDKGSTIDPRKLISRKTFTDIATQTECSTDASQLFWSIAHQIVND